MAVVAIVLLEWTVRSFDRCLGRMPERGTRLDVHPAENAPVYHAVRVGAAKRGANLSTPAATFTSPA